MKQRQVYVNGEMVPEEEARISIFDSAVLIGDSVIETARTFHHKLFRWPEHRDRLLRSIKAARMNFSLTTEELDRVTRKFLEDNLPTLEDGDEGGVGHLVSRGRMGLVLPPTESTFVMYFYPLSTGLKAKAHYYDKGLHVVTPPTRHMHPLTIDPKIKYRSRLHFSLADAEARLVDPDALPLMLDHQGNLAEGTGWNFFVVNRGEVLTPSERNILQGVSRLTTIELARGLGMTVKETDIQPYHATTADEAFMTSTSLCMMPVTRFNGQPIGDGRPGPCTLRLIERWKEYVDFDFVAHAKRWE
ncbi:MAG: aminotransferase class IV [Acidobacteria bacterium]|nr:aminotransferase class IV [Acidobacteriota bacterium]